MLPFYWLLNLVASPLVTKTPLCFGKGVISSQLVEIQWFHNESDNAVSIVTDYLFILIIILNVKGLGIYHKFLWLIFIPIVYTVILIYINHEL